MHEVSLMEAALATARELAEANGAHRILTLTLRIGALSGAVPDALRFAWDVVTRGTMAEGAELRIEEVPLACRCDACGAAFAPPQLELVCPACGGNRVRVEAGTQLDLVAVELSREDDAASGIP